MNVLASGLEEPFILSQEVVENALKKKSADHPASFYLQAHLGVLGDAWLREASEQYPEMKFIGTFPGIIKTTLLDSTFGSLISQGVQSLLEMLDVTLSEEECGVQHLNIIISQTSNFGLWDHYMIPRQISKMAENENIRKSLWTDLTTL